MKDSMTVSLEEGRTDTTKERELESQLVQEWEAESASNLANSLVFVMVLASELVSAPKSAWK